ncbi:hypothetical protein [Kitasatospora cineracea]|uniref:hypothetical protein n=1 Tax=Kitasatospora cineracea TaxID=88074 RepID=UPI0037F79338
MPVLMAAGSYAVDPGPSGGRWRSWAELAEGEAEARGYYAPVEGVRDGPVGRMLCAPGDVTGPAKRCALYGPDLPRSRPHPDLALVPLHPDTGELWPVPPGVRAVPLHAEIWRHLAFHDERPAVRAGHRLRAELARDDPQPPHRGYWPWVDHQLIRDLLARMPAVRRPGVRAAYDLLRRGYDHG